MQFFQSDGSPLAAHFSKEPYVRDNHYFGGVYTLRPVTGKHLQTMLAERIAANPTPHAHIIVKQPSTDDAACRYGWTNIEIMRKAIEQALVILPMEMRGRIRFEEV